MRPLIQPAAVALSLALLAACTTPTGTKTATGASPRPSAKPGTSASLKPSSKPSAASIAKPASTPPASAAPVVPSGVACKDAPGPVKIESGDIPRVVTLDGYDAIAGLSQGGAGLTSPVATVRLRAHPGSAGSRIMAANVTLSAGATTVGPYRVMINPVTVPGTTDTNWGTPVSVAVPVPVGDLPATGAVEARIEFIDDAEFVVKDESFQPLKVTLPLSRTATATPARQAVQTACQPEPVKSVAPMPVAIEGGQAPKVAALFSFTPSAVRLTGATAAVTLKIHAPAGGGGVSIKSLKVVYHWKQPGQTVESSEPASQPLSSAVAVPAATQTANGAPVEVPVVLDLAAFQAMAAADRPAFVRAHVAFVDDQGFVVLDPNFQDLKVEIPVLID